MRKPFWVHGGLQDNGSWAGPSATFRNEGILNHDWIKTGGGDGFTNQVPPDNPDTIYHTSQHLGLARFNLKTGERRSIRPGNPRGNISADRNWESWGPGMQEPELGNVKAPANWDAPIIISPHDSHTLYTGTNKLWKSTDQGDSWTSLGNLTSGASRRELKIMGQRDEETTPSLDDGVPFWPTLTIIAESPLKQGLLYVGTDDWNLQVSRDDGRNWMNVSDRIPGIPQGAWISGIECSRFDEGTVYIVLHNYQNDDFANYIYKSTDYGQTWKSIVGDLPLKRVLRTVRQDTKNPELLFVGSELGLYFTLDQGKHWVELKNNMPTAAFNDLVIHPRDNDLVLGTHGRGIWILDNIACLQEFTPQVLSSDFHLFTVETAEMIRYRSDRGAVGDMVFRGENPPKGAIIDYYLREIPEKDDITLSIHDASGEKITDLKPEHTKGINRVIWDLRYPALQEPSERNQTRRRSRSPRGYFVVPGLYTARLTVNGNSKEQTFEVKEDPRIKISHADRVQWTKILNEIGGLMKQTQESAQTIQSIHKQVMKLQEDKKKIDKAFVEEVKDLDRMFRELVRRERRLVGQVSGWVGGMTADQQSRMDYYTKMLDKLEKSQKKLVSISLPKVNSKLPLENKIKIEKTKTE